MHAKKKGGDILPRKKYDIDAKKTAVQRKRNVPWRIITICLGCLLIALGVFIAYGLVTWMRTISWDGVESQQFSVWDSPTGGAEIASGLTETLGFVTTPLIRNFYLQNDGTVEITVTIQNELESGCTASWSSAGAYTLPVQGPRIEATLTIDITAAGSYTWEFTIM